MYWSTRPFVRILLFLLTGILSGYFFPLEHSFSVFAVLSGLMAVLLSLIFIQLRKRLSFKWQWLQGLYIGLTFALIGYLLINLQMEEGRTEIAGEEYEFCAELVNEPVQTQKSMKMLLAVRPVTGAGCQDKPLQVLAYLAKDKASQELKYGDRFLFSGRITQPKAPMNPGEFDYKTYLARNGIYYSVFIREKQWKYLDNNPQNTIKELAVRLRHFLLQSLHENGLGGRDYAVAAAILLGYDNLMEPETKQDFVNAGAMHILCVSGLHVGVIYLVFNFLLKFLRRNRLQRIVKAVLLLFLVWAYAMLTGLAPSIQRAAVMLTVFIIGNALERRGNPFNTLAASAFLLLLLNPLLIFDVGFQLSYSAVLGILTFHQPVYRLLYFRNQVADKIWSVSVLSVAAQMGTFPLAAHYFHFFPTYFLLTNLLVFPLSFLIISVGMVFIAVSWIPFLAHWTGKALSGLIYLLNHGVAVVKYLPFYGMGDLYFPWPKVLLVYAFILLLFYLFSSKNARFVIPVLGIVLLLVSFQLIHQYNNLQQKRMVVYCINKHSAYDFISGGKHLLLLDSLLLNNSDKLQYALGNSSLKWGLTIQGTSLDTGFKENGQDMYFDGNFIAFADCKIAIVNGSNDYCPVNMEKLQFDILLVRGAKQLEISKLQKSFEVRKIVLDASVPYWKSEKIEEEARKLGIICYNVRKKGAYIVEF
ncbi:MAG: competence protein ComEC family protein [Bacteroidales bacterium]|nr:competence protein ComEC family protein [Bacteroidales bacterium]MCF6341535.1 competence protein ComEC family protein [Bacteroidales bacterium]